MENKHIPITGSSENTKSDTQILERDSVVSTPSENILGNGNDDDIGKLGESKKKRGRPRKFDSFGKLNPAYVASTRKRSSPDTVVPMSQLVYSGTNFTPHVLRVQTGENVVEKLYSFVLNRPEPQTVCVLSATGTISKVTFRQLRSSTELVTYEGLFEIVSLSGTYTMYESNGVTTKTGDLSILLAGAGGRLIGGYVAGWITAANPIQVVVGTFVTNGYKAPSAPKRKSRRRSQSAATISNPAKLPDIQNVLLSNEVDPQKYLQCEDKVIERQPIAKGVVVTKEMSSQNPVDENNGPQPSA